MNFYQFLLILRARIWIVVLTVLGFVGIATAVSLLLPQKYTATTSLVVEAKISDPLVGGVMPVQMVPGYLATQIDIINSDRVAQRVVKMLKIDEAPTVQADWRADTGGVGSVTVWLATLLKQELEVFPSRDSNVLSIAYTGSDPSFAATIGNAWAQAYIDTSLELKIEPAKQYAKWFDVQTEELRGDLETAQAQLSAYQQAQGIVATDERLDVENARLAALSTQLSIVQGQRVDSESRKAQSQNAESLPEVLQNSLVQGLRADLARQEALRDQLAGRYGSNHPELARVDAEISSLRSKIDSEIQRIVRALGTTTRVDAQRESEIQLALDAQKKKVLALKAERDQMNVLLRDVENAQRAYDLVTQRLAQTNLESQLQQTNITVLTPAVPPTKPSSPILLLNIGLAAVLGLLIGVGLALVIEVTNPRVRGVDDLTQLDGIPFLGLLPSSLGLSKA